MNLKNNVIVIEFSYDFIYLYDVCNKIRKLVKNDFPSFDGDDNPAEAILFSNEEQSMVLRIAPEKAGIMLDLSDCDDGDKEEIIKEYIRIFQKTYSALISILDIREDIEEFFVASKYIYLPEKEEISKIRNQINNITNINNIIKNKILLEERIKFKYMSDYSENEFIYEINDDENVDIQIQIKLDKQFDIYRLHEEIKRCDDVVNKFIEK